MTSLPPRRDTRATLRQQLLDAGISYGPAQLHAVVDTTPYVQDIATKRAIRAGVELKRQLAAEAERLERDETSADELNDLTPPPDSPSHTPSDPTSPIVLTAGHIWAEEHKKPLNHSQRHNKKRARKWEQAFVEQAGQEEVRDGGAHPSSSGWSGVCQTGRVSSRGGKYEGFEILLWDSEINKPLVLLDTNHVLVAARTSVLPPAFAALVDKVLIHMRSTADTILNKRRSKKYKAFNYPVASDSRGGGFFALLLGISRAYAATATFTAAHKRDKVEWNAFVVSKEVQDLSIWVSSLVRVWFPKVYDRYVLALAATNGRSLFGIFDLFCINLPSSHKNVKSIFHSDWKNLAMGVCVVVAYGMFNSRKRFFLCLIELKVIIEFPSNCALIYPSALYVHGNLHARDFKVVATEGEDLEWEAVNGKEDRGSMVWFTQANDVMLREMGKMAKDARDAGEDATSQFDMSIFIRD